MTVLPDPTTEFGARVERRLRDEHVAWLTLVDPRGTPQPAPIWFLWDGTTALIYSDRTAKRLAHLRENPRVSLSFDGNGHGGDIVVLTGEIVEDPNAPAPADNPPYLEKYGASIAGASWKTPEVFAETFGVPLRFTPTRVRGH
jgi:PPOX class probable F420-dependent enzyme